MALLFFAFLPKQPNLLYSKFGKITMIHLGVKERQLVDGSLDILRKLHEVRAEVAPSGPIGNALRRSRSWLAEVFFMMHGEGRPNHMASHFWKAVLDST